MFKQSSARNHRSKGIKIRHVLQICLLLAVCFWLIYQFKRSHDKKTEFNETDDVKAALERSSSDEALKLGRKDIHSPGKETAYSDDKDDESDENIRKEDDEDKLEEDEVGENKMKHKVDGTATSREKADSEEEEFLDDDDEEKEKEGDDDVAQGPPISDDGKSRTEKENDAREEPFKADDASSAVSQEALEKTSPDNESGERSNEESKGSDDAKGPDKGEASKDDEESNIAPTSENNIELRLDNSENGSPSNASLAQGFEGNFTSFNSTDAAAINDFPLPNVAEKGDMLDHSLRNLDGATSNINSEVSISNTIASEAMDNSSVSESLDGSNSPRDSEITSESAPEKNITLEEASAETRNRTMLSMKVEGETEHERSYSDSIMETAYNENFEGDEASESMDMSETDVRTDLNLPVIKGEGTDEDDTAAAE